MLWARRLRAARREGRITLFNGVSSGGWVRCWEGCGVWRDAEEDDDADEAALALGVREYGVSWVGGAGMKEKLALGRREGVARGIGSGTCGVD